MGSEHCSCSAFSGIAIVIGVHKGSWVNTCAILFHEPCCMQCQNQILFVRVFLFCFHKEYRFYQGPLTHNIFAVLMHRKLTRARPSKCSTVKMPANIRLGCKWQTHCVSLRQVFIAAMPCCKSPNTDNSHKRTSDVKIHLHGRFHGAFKCKLTTISAIFSRRISKPRLAGTFGALWYRQIRQRLL